MPDETAGRLSQTDLQYDARDSGLPAEGWDLVLLRVWGVRCESRFP